MFKHSAQIWPTREDNTRRPPTTKRIYQRFFKRPLDVIVASMALVFLSPLLLIVAVLVRCYLGNPVIFKQKRPGLNERVFVMYKFKTMTECKDDNGKLLPDSERLTRFGKFLRSTSFDELPELYNVIKGDMSLIGPRPLLVDYLPYFTEEERLRSKVRPGITGLAQVSGRNVLAWQERFKQDIFYVNNLSFFLDVKIFIFTIVSVLKRKNILVGSEHILKNLDVERAFFIKK